MFGQTNAKRLDRSGSHLTNTVTRPIVLMTAMTSHFLTAITVNAAIGSKKVLRSMCVSTENESTDYSYTLYISASTLIFMSLRMQV